MIENASASLMPLLARAGGYCRSHDLLVEPLQATLRIVCSLSRAYSVTAIDRPEDVARRRRRCEYSDLRPSRTVTTCLDPPVDRAVVRVDAVGQRHGRPEADVHVEHLGVELVQRPANGRVALPERAYPDRLDADLAVEELRGRWPAGRSGPRCPGPLAPAPAARAVAPSERRGRRCGRGRRASSRRRCAAWTSATVAARAGSARRRPASTRTSRCPSATGSRGSSGRRRCAAGWTGSRCPFRCSRWDPWFAGGASTIVPTVRYCSDGANTVPSRKSTGRPSYSRCPRELAHLVGHGLRCREAHVPKEDERPRRLELDLQPQRVARATRTSWGSRRTGRDAGRRRCR